MKSKFPNMTLVDLMVEANNTAVEKGWWEDKNRNVGEILALAHSEISEALEEWRSGRPLTEIYYDKKGKPCGFPVELADLLIRIADNCMHFKIPILLALREKMDYNKTRPYRHGNKLA